MRAFFLGLLLMPFAGCLGTAGDATPRAEGFVATYSKDGEPYVTLRLDGPHDRYDVDLVLRPAYRLRIESLDGSGPAWESRNAEYFDGAWRKVRDDGCSISSTECERYSVQWRSTAVEGFDVSLTGALWPFSDSSSLLRSSRDGTLIIEHAQQSLSDHCYEYKGDRPVPVRRCDGSIVLTSYMRVDLPAIPPWPDAPTRRGAGPPANELFPGAEADLQGHGFTTLEALAALKLNSPEAAERLQDGGCVVTTLFGHGSGGFGEPFPGNLLNKPLANVSFTVQEASGSSRTKYTVQWVEDSTGTRRFSMTVNANSPDEQGGPACDDVRARPWPAVGVGEFLRALAPAFGPAVPEGLAMTHQPSPLIRDQGLHYVFGGLPWGGAAIHFNATAGRFTYASYIGPNDLEPMQNG